MSYGYNGLKSHLQLYELQMGEMIPHHNHAINIHMFTAITGQKFFSWKRNMSEITQQMSKC